MSAISVAIFLSAVTVAAAAEKPAPKDIVQNATQAIEIAKRYCGYTQFDSNDDWTARFYGGIWDVRNKQPNELIPNSYLREFVRSADGAAGRCEGQPRPSK